MVKKGYERIDITFSINNEKEMELLKWIEHKSGVLNKSTLIKHLLYEIMIKEKSSD